MRDLYRLGKDGPDGEVVRHVHPRTFMEQRLNDGQTRFRIGVSGLDVFRALLTTQPAPFWVLYLHLVPRTEDRAGRYQSVEPWDRPTLDVFLDEFHDLLTTEARCDLWVKSVEGPGLLVYDRHEIVYAYGDLDRLRAVLDVEGYVPGEVLIPNPHEHPYRWQNDDAQRTLLASREWVYFPLTEGDD